MKLWSIILVAFNNLKYTRQCVDSILKNSDGVDYELILVNNGSTDGTLDYFRSIPGAVVMDYRTNQIVERVGNIAAYQAQGKYLAQVTNDTLVPPGWLQMAQYHFEQNPDCGLIGVRSNSVGSAEQIVPDADYINGYEYFAKEWQLKHDKQSRLTSRICGLVLFSPRDIYLSMGGCDENLPTNGRDGGYGFSDDDLCIRLIVEGYKILIADDIFVHHYGSVTTRDRLASGMAINKRKYLDKLRSHPNITWRNDMTGATIQINPKRRPEKRIGVWNFYDTLSTKNYMLENLNVPGCGDNILQPLNDLYRYCRDRGTQLLTLDMVGDFDSIDSFVFWDMPDLDHPLVKKAMDTTRPKYLVLCEPPIVKPGNYYEEFHFLFSKVFTWDDGLVDGVKYHKLNMAVNFPEKIYRGPKTKFCCMMAGNKTSDQPQELYSERVNTIRWFEQNHPKDFDMYGPGWEGYSSWRGFVKEKRPVLEQYKFAICYENARDLPGYITEKIWDCFFAGTIPVYWGASNIQDYIDPGCYIDRRAFESHEELYAHMIHINASGCASMLDNIEVYLKSEKAKQFTSQNFCKTIWEAIK